MAEFRTPFFRSYLVNQPELVKTVLKDRPDEFPKSNRISEGLRPLLGESVFLTNGEQWKRQRRIIDPAFEGGRLKDTFPAMWSAAQACVARLSDMTDQTVEIEAETSHAAADVIFRTLFSIPIEDEMASAVFAAFRAYQRSAPIVNLGAFLPLPRWMPRLFGRDTRATARLIRRLITELTAKRMTEVEAGTAPDDLATKIMTMADPETGERFTTEEMVDQVAIFFLAGHETSASALAWALYCLARAPEIQERVAAEAATLPDRPGFSDLSRLRFTRDVFRETLRLYPPVPMMVREAAGREHFRDRDVPKGSQVVVSPWHIQRNPRLWDAPDRFDPDRWADAAAAPKGAYLPFSSGARVCTGAGFAMAEGTLLLARTVAEWRFAPVEGRVPVPVAHLTVRSKDGIWLDVSRR